MKKLITLLFALLFFNSHLSSKEDNKPTKEQIVILGSGPAGLTAAIYTARAGLSTLVIEADEPGGQIAQSYIVENYPGFPEGIGGFELSEKMREQATRFGTKINEGKVIKADLSQRPFHLTLDDGKTLFSDVLIVATGSSAKWLGLPSEKELIGKGVSSCALCDGALYKNKEVVVIGGGDAAMEDAIYLSRYAKKVSVVHRRDSFRASTILQNQVKGIKNIEIFYNSIVEEIRDPQNAEVTGVMMKNLKKNTSTFFPCNGIFVAIGHTPNNVLFKGQLVTNPEGYLVKNTPLSTQTNIPGVFVAGDIGDPKYRQAITAAGEGAKAGIDAFHFLQNQEHSMVMVETPAEKPASAMKASAEPASNKETP